MIKKILIHAIFILVVSCGFQPILKNIDTSEINVKQINIQGKNELTYLLFSKLKFNQKNDSEGYILNIQISENTTIATRDSSGITTEENFTISISFNILDSRNNNLMNETFSETKKLEITNSISKDQTTKNIEREKIIENIAQKIKFKIIFLLKQIK